MSTLVKGYWVDITLEEGFYIAEVAALPGCLSQGSTREEALENIADAIEGWLEADKIVREEESRSE